MRVGAHAPIAMRRELGELRLEPATLIEELFWPVTLHPLLKDAHMGGILVHLPHRYLMGPPVAFGALAIDFLGAGPTLWRTQHDHRPAGSVQWIRLLHSP